MLIVTNFLQTNELFKDIKLTLSGSPAWRTGDVVRVTCCGRDTSLSLRYVNETAVAFIWVEVRKLQPVDWNSITSKNGSAAKKERKIVFSFIGKLGSTILT